MDLESIKKWIVSSPEKKQREVCVWGGGGREMRGKCVKLREKKNEIKKTKRINVERIQIKGKTISAE